MSSGSDSAVLALESGILAVQQGLYQVHRAPPRDVGLSLHLAAFAAACFGLRTAVEREVDLADLHGPNETALRVLCAMWDARPSMPRRRSLAEALYRLRHLGDGGDDGPGIQDVQVLYVAVPGLDAPERGQRAEYAVRRYRRYLNGVFCYSCDPKAPNTWDEAGEAFALDRAFFRDIYRPGQAPKVEKERSVFGLVLRSFQSAAA